MSEVVFLLIFQQHFFNQLTAVHRLAPLCQEARRHLAAAKVSIIFNKQPLQSLFLALASSLAFIFCLGGVERIVYAYAYALRV